MQNNNASNMANASAVLPIPPIPLLVVRTFPSDLLSLGKLLLHKGSKDGFLLILVYFDGRLYDRPRVEIDRWTILSDSFKLINKICPDAEASAAVLVEPSTINVRDHGVMTRSSIEIPSVIN